MSKTLKILLIIAGVSLSLIIIIGISVLIFSEIFGSKNAPTNSVLVIDVSGSLDDYSPKIPTAEMLGIYQPDSFADLLTNLRKAKVDDRVTGVMLDIDMPDIGWAKADELRAAIADFRKSGKPVYAYVQLGMNKDYYIATAAEKIFVPPSGDLFVNGFSAVATFYRGTLDKLGIEPEVIQIGKYKNAPDQYTRKDMSEGQREVTNSILDQYYDQFVNAVAQSRNKSVDEVTAMINNAPYHGNEANKIGLTDGAMYKNQVFDEFKKKLGYAPKDELRTIDESDYDMVSAESLGLDVGKRIAVIYVSGTINVGSSSSNPYSGAIVGSDTITEAVEEAADDNSIKAIVLRVDSPGGSSLASDLMWNSIEQAKQKKPVVVSMADYAASGGYYISCGANKIVAEPNTLTGSIGMFMGKPVLKGFYEWAGVSTEAIQRGQNAGIFRTDESWTESEKKKMEQQANSIYYSDFLPKVAAGRKMTIEKVDSLGQGHVWTGTQAKENGLIDEIGGLETAITIAKQLAKIPNDEEVKRVSFPAPSGLFASYFGGDTMSKVNNSEEAQLYKAMPEGVKKAFRAAALFDQMKPGDAMLLLPFQLEIR